MAQTVGWVSRIKQAACGLMGHHMILKTSRGRIDVECTRCLMVKPGWRVGPGNVATLDPQSEAAIAERARRKKAEWAELRKQLQSTGRTGRMRA